MEPTGATNGDGSGRDSDGVEAGRKMQSLFCQTLEEWSHAAQADRSPELTLEGLESLHTTTFPLNISLILNLMCSKGDLEQQVQTLEDKIEGQRTELQQYEKELEMFREIATDLKVEKARTQTLEQQAGKTREQLKEAQSAVAAKASELSELQQKQVPFCAEYFSIVRLHYVACCWRDQASGRFCDAPGNYCFCVTIVRPLSSRQ
jgi:regulator of replication initiation timing